jgi:hypothetical protein
MEAKAARLHKELYLPIDQVVAKELGEGTETHRVWTMEFGSGKACTYNLKLSPDSSAVAFGFPCHSL